ncbi:hypothetical protein DRP07_04295 [Archaeoglobales archaeon]|nr:MAG: hypothetical protein DRP07_04295 [Archaeoglobales archaeon]
MVHPEDVDKVKIVFRKPHPHSCEFRLIGRRGLRYVKLISDVLKLGSETLVFGILRDITELKEKKDLLENLEERTHTGIYIVQGGRFRYVNKKLTHITGYSEEELLQMDPFDLIHPDYINLVRERYYRRESGEEVPERYEWKIVTKNGEERWVEVIASRIELNGMPAVLGNVFDITHRKVMEEKLRRSEEKYRSLLEAINDVVFVLDTEGRFVFLNTRFEEVTLYSKNEWIGRHFSEIVAPEYLESTLERFKRGITGEKIPLYEIELVRKDGKRIPVELNVTNLYEGDRIVGRLGIARDISERKAMERKILESEEKFRKLAEKSLVGIYLIQDGVFKYVNPKFAELWGYKIDELVGRSPLEFVHPADRDLVDRNLRVRLEGEVDSINYKLRVIRKDGEIRVNEVYDSRIIYKGKPAVIGTLIDITEEERYKKELERYRRFYRNAQDLFFILDSKARFLEVNPKYAELLGYKREELIGHTARRLMDPEGIDKVREMFKKVMRGEVVRYEVKALPKDKKRTYLVEVILWPVFENGRVVGAEGIVRDITERKKLEEELRKSEEKYRLIVENSRDVIKVVNAKGIREYVSPSAERIFGYTAEELIGKSAFENIHPEDRERVKNEFYNAAKERRGGEVVYRYRKKDGSWIWAESVGTPIIKNGKVIGGVIVTRDVTERVELEKKLRESEERYRKTAQYMEKMVNIAPVPIMSWDSNYRIKLWNKAAEEQFGWKADEVIGKNLLEVHVPEEERNRVKRILDGVVEGKAVVNINPALTKNGERRIFEWHNFAIGKGEDRITTSIGIDLTERIEMERKLIESEEKFRKLFETSPTMIAILDYDGVFIDANPAMIKSIGFNPVGKKLSDLFSRKVAERRLKKVREVIESNHKVEFQDSRGDRYFSNIFSPLTLKGKRYCVVLARDITQYLRMNRLLNAINEINKLVVHERDVNILLEKACMSLASLREYYSAWAGLIRDGRLRNVASSREMHPVDFSLEELPACFEKAKRSVQIVKRTERREVCPYYSSSKSLSCIIIPMRVEGELKGFIVMHSKEKLPGDEEIDMLQTLADDLAFAINTIELDEAKRRAYERIENNIEQFAILVDQIRNPLAIITGLAELKADGKLRSEIVEQVDKIDRLIQKLDRGWLESEKVREFLRKSSK